MRKVFQDKTIINNIGDESLFEGKLSDILDCVNGLIDVHGEDSTIEFETIYINEDETEVEVYVKTIRKETSGERIARLKKEAQSREYAKKWQAIKRKREKAQYEELKKKYE